MALLDKNALIQALRLKTEEVKLEDGHILVTEIPAAEYMEICNNPNVKDAAGDTDGQAFMALLSAHCIVDESGCRVFEDNEAGLLANASPAAYARVLAAVQRLNGLGDDTRKN